MIDPRFLVEMLSSNIERSGNPIGVENSKINTWWSDAEVKKDGEWLFFTGMMYQLSPYIESIVSYLEKVENSGLQRLLGLSKNLPLPFGILSRTTPEERRKEADRILRCIHSLLLKSGVEVFYRPELDAYTGILLYDFGDDEGFERHARKVAKALESAGVKRIVTADPHTSYALEVLYPKYTGAEFEVSSYIELVRPRKKGNKTEVVVHDPCYYGRYLEISDEIRRLLRDAGVGFTEPKYSGRMTNCCGGPIEAISPSVSKEIAKLRLSELEGGVVVTACPICMVNLRRTGGEVVDLATVIGDEDC
ncbi:(Fe-S)-binding protein [Geoglobus ahangari]